MMENIIYNELLIRGYNVDVGVTEHKQAGGKADRAFKRREQGAVSRFLQRLRRTDGRKRSRFFHCRLPPWRKMIFDTFCSDDAPFESFLKD